MRRQPARTKLVEGAIKAGINYFDTTQREETESLGLALEQLGEKKNVHATAMLLGLFRRMAEKPTSEWRQMVVDDVEDRLRLLRADQVDILTLLMPEHDYTSERLTRTVEILQELRKEGKIRFIGASSHQLPFLAELVRRYDCFDTIMVQYNYHLQDARDVIFPLAKALQIGVIVMKPLAWPYYGLPFTRFGPLEADREGGCTPAQTSLRWILSSNEVSTVVPSMNNEAELEENLGAIAKEGRVDEKTLGRYLSAAQGTEGQHKLKLLQSDPDVDISFYARRALTETEQ